MPTDTAQAARLAEPEQLTGLRESARGWHGVQLAVLGFISLCGVLQGESSAPRWLQILSGLLVLAALGLACVATAMVASVAWPLYGGEMASSGVTPGLRRRLRRGVGLTFVAVASVALAATASWWPDEPAAGAALVQVRARAGSVCGELQVADPGSLAVNGGTGRVVVALGDVLEVTPVQSC